MSRERDYLDGLMREREKREAAEAENDRLVGLAAVLAEEGKAAEREADELRERVAKAEAEWRRQIVLTEQRDKRVQTLTDRLLTLGRTYHAVAHDFLGGHDAHYESCLEFVCSHSRSALSTGEDAK